MCGRGKRIRPARSSTGTRTSRARRSLDKPPSRSLADLEMSIPGLAVRQWNGAAEAAPFRIGGLMHAALIRLAIDPAQAPAAAAAFTQTILPRIKAADGFVGGYWVDPVD